MQLKCIPPETQSLIADNLKKENLSKTAYVQRLKLELLSHLSAVLGSNPRLKALVDEDTSEVLAWTP